MKKSSKRWTSVLLLLTIGCARTDVPAGLLESSQAFRQVSGTWAVVRTDSSEARGELLAVEHDTIFLVNENVLAAIDKNRVREAKAFLQEFPLTSGQVATWTILGTLSTASNGLGCVITAPLWLLTGGITGISTASAANRGDYMYPDDPWEGLRKFARFPQGLPSGIPREKFKEAYRQL